MVNSGTTKISHDEKPQISYQKADISSDEFAIPSDNFSLSFVEYNSPSKKELWKLFDKDSEKMIEAMRTIKQKNKDELKEALQELASSENFESDYTPTYSHNIKIRLSKKIEKVLEKKQNFQEFQSTVDLSKNIMEEKIYKWVISNVQEDSITVLIGKMFWNPIEYTIHYSKLTPLFQKRKYLVGDDVFVDVKKNTNDITLVSRLEFERPRREALSKLGIEINWVKPIFYQTKSWNIIRGKVIWIGQDSSGEQVIFENKDTKKKFALSLDNLQKWMKLARDTYIKTKK